MNDLLLHGFLTEIIIVAIEAVIFFPFTIIDYLIVKKIIGMGFSDKNRIKFPIAIAAMFVCGLIVFCILGHGFDFAVFDNDIYTALVVVSALCAFGMALPICDFIRYKFICYKILNNKKKAE